MEWSNEAGEATTEDTSIMSPEELTALKLNRTSGTNHQDIDDATRFLRGTQMKTMGVQVFSSYGKDRDLSIVCDCVNEQKSI